MSRSNFQNAFSLAYLFLFVVGAQAQTVTNNDLKLWPEAFYQNVINRPEELKLRLTNALFESEIIDQILNDNFNKKFSPSLKFKREVYNNYDLLETWTVVDRFRIRLSSQLLGVGDAGSNYAIPGGHSSFGFFGISFGVSGILDLRDIKQLLPAEVANLSLPKPLPSPDEAEGDIQELNPYLSSLDLNSSPGETLHKALNRMSIPFRMPISRRNVRHMQIGEILSYNISGQVGFGGSLGWEVLPASNIHFGVEVDLETHLNGEFQVSVLKEDERFAKVRVSKIRGIEKGSRVAVGAELHDLFQGFFILKGSPVDIHAGEISFKIIPFSFQTSISRNKEVDVSYRYDLDSLEGRDAYHQAVLGKLVLSEKLAQEEVGAAHPTVTKVYNRSSANVLSLRAKGSNITLLFTLHKSAKTFTENTVETEITDLNGTKTLFRSYAENKNENHFWNGANEKVLRRISILLDKDGFKAGAPGSILLIGENIIEDSKTSSGELNSYAKEVMDFFQDQKLFPVFPDRAPRLNSRKPHRIRYGRSSFYFGFSLGDHEMSEFLHSDFEQLLAQAAENNVHLEKDSLEGARAAFDARDSLKTYLYLKSIFSDQKHEQALMKITLSTLKKDSFEKFLVAQNLAFGNFQNRGHHMSAMEHELQSTEAEMGLGTNTYRSVEDTHAIVTSLEATVMADKKIQIRFILANDPEFLFFHVNPLANPNRQKAAEELVVYNRDQRFKKGENFIILDPTSADSLIHKLSAKLRSDEEVMFTVGYSQKKAAWGYGASTRFVSTKVFGPTE